MAILITPGEPAGIGPDITVIAAQHEWPHALVTIADPSLLQERAQQLHLPLKLIEVHNIAELKPASKATLYVLPVQLKQAVASGKLDSANASYVEETLRMAARLCLDNEASALVTGPVNKALLNEAGIKFSGHTEFFAEIAGIETTVMLFVTPELRVALATTHIPLSQVSSAVTPQKLISVITTLNAGLQQQFGIAHPRIAVCGLNPHAGENGHLGSEEITTITPTIKELQRQGLSLQGPYPADTIFTQKILGQADVILAMYHDQALPVVKYKNFSDAVNVTLGLPFIRTSVDHGTAIDLAGSGDADPGSMIAAIKLAIELANIPQ